MPIIGSPAGLDLKQYISSHDHWIATGILAFAGGRMIAEAFEIRSAEKNLDPSNLLILLTLSVPTSIDALVVGSTLSLPAASPAFAVPVIGLITFILSWPRRSDRRAFRPLFRG